MTNNFSTPTEWMLLIDLNSVSFATINKTTAFLLQAGYVMFLLSESVDILWPELHWQSSWAKLYHSPRVHYRPMCPHLFFWSPPALYDFNVHCSSQASVIEHQAKQTRHNGFWQAYCTLHNIIKSIKIFSTCGCPVGGPVINLNIGTCMVTGSKIFFGRPHKDF